MTEQKTGKLCLMTIVGTRPEIIKMSAIIKKADQYFNQILVHTGQNYDYELNKVFFEDLGIREGAQLTGVIGVFVCEKDLCHLLRLVAEGGNCPA